MHAIKQEIVPKNLLNRLNCSIMLKIISKVIPKYYQNVNAEAIDVKPLFSEEQKKMNNRLTRTTEKLTFPVYTIINWSFLAPP